MLALARIQGIDQFIAGDAVVTDDELQRKLGRAAYLTWQILCAHRDYQGETHITVRGMLRAKSKRFAGKLSRRPLLRALGRLADSRLVDNLGYQLRVVPRGDRFVNMMVFVRRVRGARVLRNSREAAASTVVPVATKSWLVSASEWGGKRGGAGRPTNSSGHLEHGREEESSGHLDRPESGIQVVTPKKSNTNHRENTGCGVPLTSFGETRGAVAPSSLQEFEGGLSGGARHAAPLLGFPFRDVPRYPGNSVVAPATMPDAPTLPEAASDEVLALELAKTYRGAIEARYGGRCHILAKGDIKRSKHFKHLVAFAKELIAHDIAPAVWCIHRIDRWKATREVPPSIIFVYAMSAISDERRWQFRVEYGDCRLGGRQVFSRTHRGLLERYKRMHSAIVSGTPKAAAVAQHFPDDLYNRLVDEARIEAAEMRLRLEDQIKRGAFVW